ncbi:NARE ribosyltransferase, partial [Vireo altiloquus]|nr:NARE ribosyltransferase [Vireo altiloquus]
PAMTKALPALKDSELQQNKNFAQVWAKATADWEKKLSSGSYLSSHQAIALLAYTMDELYEEFNAAVHEAGSSRQEYRDNFHFKALHFLLTQAMRRLREIQGEQCQCLARGVRGVQFKAEPGDIVRFGQFMAMSLCEKFDASGMDTVFYVGTCQGVDIRDFSSDPSKKQVLIPPFHTFKVNFIRKEGGPTQIHLNASGTHSNYNCEWLQGDVTEGTTWGDG